MFLLLFIFLFPLFSQPVELLSKYCVNDKYIYLSDIVKSTKEDKKLFSLPKTSTFDISTLEIIEILKKHNIKYTDKTKGTIRFDRICDIRDSIDFLNSALEEKYIETYPNIFIKSVDVFPQTKLPGNFKELEFISLHINPSNLRKNYGNMRVSFLKSNGHKKNIYFKYSIKAKIPLFKAKYNLSKGKILTSSDYLHVEVDLKSLPLNFLKNIKNSTLETKQTIKKGTILTQRQFRRRQLVQKNSYVLATLRDGGLVLQFEAKALSGGNKGETIRIKNDEGKLFNAIIVSENKVVIN